MCVMFHWLGGQDWYVFVSCVTQSGDWQGLCGSPSQGGHQSGLPHHWMPCALRKPFPWEAMQKEVQPGNVCTGQGRGNSDPHNELRLVTKDTLPPRKVLGQQLKAAAADFDLGG